VTPEAKEYLLHKGFDARFGARPLRQLLLKDIDAPLADLLASGGIPHGSRVLVHATGITTYGKALEFYYESAPELITQAEQLRAAEVGAAASYDQDNDSVPSLSLDTGHGLRSQDASIGSNEPPLPGMPRFPQ
jgi:hypothetical protein